MEKVLKLYKYIDGVNDTSFPSVEYQAIVSDFRYDVKRMGGAPIITCTVMHTLCLDKLWSDNVYAYFNGERFFIKQIPTSSYNNTDSRYKHELELVSERIVLDNVYFYDVVDDNEINDKPVSNSSTFSFFGDINEFASRLNQSLQYSNVDYSVVVDDGISSEAKMVSFQDQFFSGVIQEGYNTYNVPFYFEGKVIHFGYTINAITRTFKYGDKESLLSIQKQNANYKVVNRVTGVGSEDNIPYYYPNEYESKEEVEANGGVWINPQRNLMPSIYRESLGDERFYEALNYTYRIPGSDEYYEFENPYIEGKPKEHIVNFDYIKPTIKGIANAEGLRIDMFKEFAYDENDNDEVDEEGNYLHPYFFAKLRKFDGEHGFNLFDHAIDEQEMVISMTSGSCGACEFVIGVDESTQKNTVQVDSNGYLKRDDNGNVKFGAPQDEQNDTKNNEVWIALRKDVDTFGVIMPNATNNYKPSVNDTFVILHIDLPKAYILAAEDKLKEELIKYMSLNNSEKFNFSVSFSRIFFAENEEILKELNENARIQIEYDNTTYELYISSYSYSMSKDSPLPEIRIELSDTLTVSQNALQTAISDVKNEILSSIGGSANIDILKQGLRYFLRKDKDDKTPYKLNVGDNLTAEKGIQIGKSFIPGILEGSGGYFDEYANGEVERLTIRRELRVPSIVFNQVEVLVGDKWRSPGAGVIKRVEPDYNSDGTLSNTGTCWLKLEEGQIGAIFNNAICMGIFHDFENKGNNATEDMDDSRGNRTFAGFTTAYFTITEITDYTDEEGKVWRNKQFRYQIRPVSERWSGQAHPYEQMNFTCYGIFSDNEELLKKYGTSVYETRTYTRMLFNQNTWEIGAANIAMQYGNMENMSVHGLDMTGYSMYLNNIYMTGVLKQIKPDGTPVNQANDRGAWVSGTTYAFYDRVSHNGSLWLCLNESGTNTEPKKGNSDWLLQVASGDSFDVSGRFSSSKAPYSPNSTIDFANKVWASTETVDYAPYGIWTDASGNRFQFNDGGFCLVDDTEVRSGWTVFVDLSGFKDGEDGKSLIVQYSKDGSNWHDTFQSDDIYMRQKLGEDGAWSNKMRIVGEAGAAGENGEYTDFEFAVNDSMDVAPLSGWQDAPPSVGRGQYLWMRQRVVHGDGTADNWSHPVRIGGEKGDSVEFVGHYQSGVAVPVLGVVAMGDSNWVAKVATTNPPLWTWTDTSGNRFIFSDGGYALTGEENEEEYELMVANGKDGKDGTDYEYIFINTTTDTQPATPPTVQRDDYIPNGWHDDPLGVTEGIPYEWVSQRKKKDGLWGAYSTPSVWAKFGEDGTNWEFVYQRTKTESAPSTPLTKQEDDYIPSGWTDDPKGVSDEYPFEWMSKRRKKGSAWGEYTKPALWSSYSILSYKSTVFIRTNDTPSTPTGGSYDSPIPTSTPKWYDGIPSGEQTLWASTRIFTKNGSGIQQGEWSTPRSLTDTASFEAIYHDSEKEPTPPTNYPSTSGSWTPDNGWTDDPTDKSVWMATATKSNGVWGAWQVTKIKGEKGVDGKDGKDYEYIYRRTTYGSPSRPNSLQEDDYVPENWTDDPMGVTDYYLYEWTCKRTKKDGVWSEFSEPALWAKFGVNGTDGKDGQDGKDGEQGKQGIQGCILRKSEWKEGVEYRNDEEEKSGTRYVDVVLVRNENATTGWDAYKCIETHTSTSLTKPPHSGFFEPFGLETNAIFTSLIIAKDASIDFMQGNELLIKGSDGVTVEAGLSGSSATGGDIRLWVGGETPDDAPFKVDKYGNMVATAATITGEINAESGTIGGFSIDGNSIVSDSLYKMRIISNDEDSGKIVWSVDSGEYARIGVEATSGGYMTGVLSLADLANSSAMLIPTMLRISTSLFSAEIDVDEYSGPTFAMRSYVSGYNSSATIGMDSAGYLRIGGKWSTSSSQVNVGEVYSDNGTLKIRRS